MTAAEVVAAEPAGGALRAVDFAEVAVDIVASECALDLIERGHRLVADDGQDQPVEDLLAVIETGLREAIASATRSGA